LVPDAPLDPPASVSPDVPELLELVAPLDEDELLDPPEELLLLEAAAPLDDPLLEASSAEVASGGAEASMGPIPPPWIETFAQ
jgi:hypothetical protein